jgi:hypothetical protein
MRSTLAGLAVMAVIAQGNDLELTAVPRENPTEARTDVELTNTSAKVAVAWSIRIHTAGPPSSGPLTITSDAGIALMDDPLPRTVLQPNQSRRIPGPARSGGPVTSVVPLAVVFSDDTAEGDPTRIAAIFERRRAEAAEWEQILPALERVRRNVTPQTLRFAASELIATPDGRQASAVRRTTAASLESAATSDDPADVLESVIRRGRATAVHLRSHSSRR